MRKLLIIALVLISTLCEGQSGWLNYSGAKNYAMWTTKWLQADNIFYWKGDTIKKEFLGYLDIKLDSVRFKYIGGSWSPWYYAGRGAYVLPVASASTLGGVKVGTGLSITNGVLSSTGGDLSGYVPYTGATTNLDMGTKRIKSNGSYLPVEDGTILYHTTKWFAPTAGATISTLGTTATMTGSTQFSTSQIGAKLTIAGESRIIVSYTSSTVVVVNSAYSQNYSGISDFGVYARALWMVGDYLYLGNPYNQYINIGSGSINLKTASLSTNGGEFNISTSGLVSIANGKSINWSSTTGSTGTKDLGLRRNTSGVLEIYDGITSGAYRDILLRNITASGQFVSSLATGTAPLNVASTTLNTNLNADLLDGYHSSSFVLNNDSRLTDSRPASDVYSWAKALIKPEYEWSEITNKPTIGTTTNAHILKFDTGTNEGTDLYTFNGSAAKTLDIKAGPNITLSKSAGSITISAAGNNDVDTPQMLTGTSPVWNYAAGKNATIVLTGNTTITMQNIPPGKSGSLTVKNASTAYTLNVTGYTNAIGKAIGTIGNYTKINVTGASKLDKFSFSYDGTYLFWNGNLDYITAP